MRLLGKVIWVTGSARRVGRAIAIECAREGADIVLHYNNSRDDAESARAEITALGRRAEIVQGDLGVRSDVQRIVREIEQHFGRLSALVNSASTFPRARFEDVTEEDFFEVLRANLYNPFQCAQLALPLLRRERPAHIINITDWAVERPYRHHAHYMAAKGGLATLTRALARELAPDVLVNAIAPGAVLPPPGISESERNAIVAKTPLGRWGSPDDIAQAAVMVLSSYFMTGSTVTVDGGRFLQG